MDAFFNSVYSLYSAPRIPEPIWLSMMTCSSQRSQLSVKFLNDFIALTKKCDTKSSKLWAETRLFMSTATEWLKNWMYLTDHWCINKLLHIWLDLCLVVLSIPQATYLWPTLSCAAASIFLQLYLKPAVHIYLPGLFFQVFVGRPLLWSFNVHFSLIMLSFFRMLHIL